MAKDIIYTEVTLPTPLEDQALNEDPTFQQTNWTSNTNGVGFGNVSSGGGTLDYSISTDFELVSGKLPELFPQGSYDVYYNLSAVFSSPPNVPIYFGFSPATSGYQTTGIGRAEIPIVTGAGMVTIEGNGYLTIENLLPENAGSSNYISFNNLLIVPAGSVTSINVIDIVIKNGDFLLAEAENSGELRNFHAEDIVLDSAGQWMQSPLVGVGIRHAINGNQNPFLRSEIVKQLTDDNFKIKRIFTNFTGSTQEVEIDADKG